MRRATLEAQVVAAELSGPLVGVRVETIDARAPEATLAGTTEAFVAMIADGCQWVA